MRSRVNRDFREAYRRLPADVQRRARERFRLFIGNPSHPSLAFKRVATTLPVYAARVTGDYRVLGVMREGDIVWFWIGPHSEYDRLLRNL